MARTNPFGLADQMFRFCQCYIKRGFRNAGGAYQDAYPTCRKRAAADVGGSRLLRKTKVRAYLKEVQEQAGREAQVDADYVIRGLKAEAERQGPGSAHSARVRALELLGKTLGVFADHLETRPEAKPIGPEVSYVDRLLAQLDRMAARQAQHDVVR